MQTCLYWGGGKDGIDEPERKAMRRASMKEQVQHFKANVKKVVEMTMNYEDKERFKPNAMKKPRLKGCGIDFYMAMANFQMFLIQKAKE